MQPEPRVQRDNAIPLYHQIYLALRDEISSGELPYDSMAPTEYELAERFGVSRITARRSLRELAENLFVERRRRIGTRVIYRASRPAVEMTPDQALDSLIAFGRDTDVRVIDYAVEPASVGVAAALGVAPGQSMIRALRLRLLRGEPLGVIESYVPETMGATLSRERLSGTPLLELLRSAGHIVGDGQQLVSAIGAGPGLASQLAVESRAPILRIERITRTVDGAPLARTIAHYRSDRYRLALDIHGSPRPITS